MRHPSPPAMSLYRTRPLEVQAIDCGDGRHVILEETPRYVPSAEFLERFELVEERRAKVRRVANGRGPAKGKKERRAGPGRRQQNGDGHPEESPRARARALWDEGKEASAIAQALKTNPANVYYWKKMDKWPERKASAARPATAAAGKRTASPEEANLDGDWMK
jgi:hypothetical protein